jgi:uncharacterized damage-inducible protein DinB
MQFAERALHIHAGPAWHGRSTKELLVGLTADQACQRPAENVHSVAELLGHMMAWRDWAIRMMRGQHDYRIVIDSDVDWPSYERLSDDEWAALLQANDDQMDELRTDASAMTDEQLDSRVGDRPFDHRWALQFVLDHDVYHGGQIAVARKLIGAPYPPEE